jgi:SAM-dependent methyltransferase
MKRRQGYYYGTNSQDSRRLAMLSMAHDEASMRWLLRLGIAPSWNCLEVGAGNGSLALRIAELADTKGSVVAVDIDMELIADFEEKHGIGVRRHDIEEDGPVGGEFDLVHARMVVSHLDKPMLGLRNMVRSLKPGGLLVVEDLDKTSSSVIEESGSFAEDRERVAAIVASSGYDPFMGRRLPGMFRELGLTDLFAEGSIRIAFGGSGDPVLSTYSATLETLRERQDPRFNDETLNRIKSAVEDSSLIAMSSTMIVTSGRRASQQIPAASCTSSC